MTKYGFGKTVDMSFDDAIVHVTQALQGEGFGILADIDVAGAMKQKLNQDMPPYRILGACNPPLAHRALESEPSIGLLLPCNVVVRQDEAGAVHVEFMDPNAVLELVNKPEITALASEVRQRLERVSVAMGGSEEARSAQADGTMPKVKVDTQQMHALRTLTVDVATDIKLLVTRTCHHCGGIEQELRDLGLIYERYYAEEHPELVERFQIRHCPVLIIDEARVIPVDGLTERQIRALLSQD